MTKFYFTFGQKYRNEEHPAGGHPDGWFTVKAIDEDDAWKKMMALCGPKWSMCYSVEPDKELFPRGELKVIE